VRVDQVNLSLVSPHPEIIYRIQCARTGLTGNTDKDYRPGREKERFEGPVFQHNLQEKKPEYVNVRAKPKLDTLKA
jgi:hypothetical protein